MALVGHDNTLDEGMLLLIKKRKDDNDEWEAWSRYYKVRQYVLSSYLRTLAYRLSSYRGGTVTAAPNSTSGGAEEAPGEGPGDRTTLSGHHGRWTRASKTSGCQTLNRTRSAQHGGDK